MESVRAVIDDKNFQLQTKSAIVSQASPSYEKIEKGSGQKSLSPCTISCTPIKFKQAVT